MTKKNPDGWRRFHDPNATPKDYERWREEHRQRALNQALAMMLGNTPRTNGSVAALAKSLGLSAQTVRNYSGENGKVFRMRRGPLLATYLLMKAR